MASNNAFFHVNSTGNANCRLASCHGHRSTVLRAESGLRVRDRVRTRINKGRPSFEASLAGHTYFASARRGARKGKGEGENTYGVPGQVFVR